MGGGGGGGWGGGGGGRVALGGEEIKEEKSFHSFLDIIYFFSKNPLAFI